MKLKDKYIEKDIIVTDKVGINKTKKKMLRMVIVKFNIETKKGKAIAQILDGIKRLL